MEKKHIEIVVPAYNEQECVRTLFEAVSKVFSSMERYDFSVLYVNDGSTDGTLDEIKRLVEEYGSDKVRYISFARNFGKESAIYAGFDHCRGDYIVLMDADLQHPPELLPEMIRCIEEGHDCCGARRVSRDGEPVIRSFFSRIFYHIINRVSAMQLVPGGSDYRIMTKQMVDAIVSLSERERFIKGIMSWVGFDTKWITYKNVERYAGKSKWSFFGLTRYAWNGFISFATTPLRVVVYMGFLIIFVTIVYALSLVYQMRVYHRPWVDTMTIILLILMFGGAVITILGVIGEYMARIYLELKHRPIYLVKEDNLGE